MDNLDNLDGLPWLALENQTRDGLTYLLNGLTITGAEPIDYPLTDGMILYLQTPDGQRYALDTGLEIDRGPWYARLIILPATAPSDAI